MAARSARSHCTHRPLPRGPAPESARATSALSPPVSASYLLLFQRRLFQRHLCDKRVLARAYLEYGGIRFTSQKCHRLSVIDGHTVFGDLGAFARRHEDRGSRVRRHGDVPFELVVFDAPITGDFTV